MRFVSLRLEDMRTMVLNLGYVGENEHTRVQIDAKKMYDQYPNASASLTVCPPAGESYPAVIERDGDYVIWDIVDSYLTDEGSGEFQLSFTTGETVAKTYIGRFRVCRSIVPTGTIPSGLDDFLTRAGAALTAIPETINEALQEAKDSGEFDGADGVSPTVSITDITGGHRITITDAQGTSTADVMDGEDGDPGTPGDDGVSPTVTVTDITGGHRVTITDAEGDHTFDVMDGQDGSAADIIDDNSTAADKVWSAQKSNSLKNEINEMAVTPEMFGAKGDGETDDTTAINDMFDSGYKKFMFGNKTYLVDGSIDVDFACDIHFNNTTLKAKGNTGIRDFEYVIAFKAPKIHTYGELTVKCETSVNIGILLAECGNSIFDSLSVTDARIWGICTDNTTEGNNGIVFNSIWVVRCGYKATAKAKYHSGTQLDLTDIASTKTYFANIKEDLFANTYRQSEVMIDDSGYLATYNFSGEVRAIQHNRRVFWPNTGSSPFTLDEQDTTKGTYVWPSGANVEAAYVDGENGRNVFIPIGGGIYLQSGTSEGVYTINKLTTQSCPLGARLMMPYGGSIGTFISEYDTVVMMTNAMGLNIDALYNEATGNGLSYKFNNGYDKIICITSNNTPKVSVCNTILNTPFVQGNCVVVGDQTAYMDQLNKNPLKCTQYEAGRKCSGAVFDWPNGNCWIEVDEFTPSDITIDCQGYTSSVNHIRINLVDITAFRTNRFQPMHLYVRQRVTNHTGTFNISLQSALITAGYTIEGAVNNVYSVAPIDYGSYVKITIILFPYTKKFHMYAEPISESGYEKTSNLVTSLSNTNTDTQYPSAKCVYDIIGDVESLLSAI